MHKGVGLERSAISRATWWPCYLTVQIYFSFFVEGHFVTISAKSFSILTIGFRVEDV